MRVFINIISILILSLTSYGASETEMIRNNIPNEFFVIDSMSRAGQKLVSSEVSFQFIKETFNNTSGITYYIVNYVVFRTKSKLVVLGVNKKGDVLSSQMVNVKPELDSDYTAEFAAEDLDGDGVNEIIKYNFDDSIKDFASIYTYKWISGKLVDITPVFKEDRVVDSLFTQTISTKFKVNNRHLLIRRTDDGKEIFQLNRDNTFSSLGKFAYLFFVEKENKKFTKQDRQVDLEAGTYTLEVKNISNHKHAVRAEITVNGNIVLKPEDFCTEKPKKKFEKRKDKHGKFAAEDDDDDQDEDGCKRCQMKKDVYADVKLNATNTISVKLYGNKHSRIQVTLKKKN